MQLYPAVHISVFGVYPDRPVDTDLAEGLTGSRADTLSAEVAREGNMDSVQISRLLEGTASAQDLADLERFEMARDEHVRIRDVAELRMRTAYGIAAREKWIKPVSGMIYLADPIPVRHDVNLAEAIERACTESFYQFVCREKLPTYQVTVSEDDTVDNGLTGVAFIRCVINGEVQKPSSTVSLPHMFKSLSSSLMEPVLDVSHFDLTPVDTLLFVQSQPELRQSRFLGFAGGAAPGPRWTP